MAPAVQPEASAGAGRQLRCCLLLADQRAPLALLCAELDLFGTECCLKSDTTVSAPAAPLCFSLLDQSVNLVGVVLTISQFLSLILTSTGDQMYSPHMTVLLIFACHACGATLLVKILSMKQTQSGRALAIQGINAILFFAPLIFKSLGRGQSSSLLGAVAVSAYLGLPELVILACILV